MAAASHQMMIKYGLGHEPTSAEVARWAAIVRQLISQGSEREAAGEHAAKQLFTDFRTRHFASQADTIDTLLRLAEQK
jgi:hypothetical protein